MKSFRNNMRPFMLVVSLVLILCGSVPGAHAQSVSVSPGDLSFGVPTGTSPAVSAPDFVIVNISGTSGSVTFTSVTASASDFVIDGNSCTGVINAPNTCQVTLHFSASAPPATTLESATLTIVSSAGTLVVPMNGAYGAVKLFSALDVNPSLFSGVTWPNSAGNPVKTATVNLSCPANPTAVLSSTPDGSSNVFQDNTIEVANKVGENTTTTTNVCYGGDPNFQGFMGFPAGTSNCFQSAYESYASTVLGMSQRNPDLVPGLIKGYGVQPLNLMSPPSINNTPNLYAPVLVSGNQTLTVQLLDAGGDLGAATLHLATNCSLAGVTPGGTITGNPITSGNISSQTQTFTFDNGGGQNISFVSSEATAIQQGTVPAPNGVVPIVTNFGIPQTAFDALINGTSAAPAVCLRLTGEINPVDGTTMCKGYQIQCFDPTTMTTSGDNCVPNASAARNLFDAAQYASPDAPAGADFLASACQNYMSAKYDVSGGTCATPSAPGPNPTTLVGPGILLGGDNWLTTPYAAANCTLTGTLSGDLCPLDTMTQFLGAADALSGSTTTGRNSIFVPVVNMPEPFTSNVSVSGATNGWVKTNSATVNFTSNQATYTPTSGNPPTNNFVAAPPYSLTYGITPASAPIPDTTYPVAGDITNYNAGVQPNFAPPVCKPAPPNPFVSTGTFNSLADGIYNVHYFTTDCAFTEELLFTPITNNPTANWASFQFITIGVDTLAPQVSSCNSPATSVWYNSNQSVSCTVTDTNYVAGASGSGFPPLLGGIQGSPSENVVVSTNVAANTANAAAATSPTQACDIAGNCVNIPAGPFMIDMLAPTISGPALTPAAAVYYVGGPAVTVTYSCSDGPTPPNSGIASCLAPLASGGTIDTSAAALGPHTFTVTAIDNAGNKTMSNVNYSVAYASADLAVAATNLTEVETGDKAIYGFIASDLGPSSGHGVAITDTLPSGLTFVSASMTNGSSAVNCTYASGAVTCPIGDLAVLPAKGSTWVGEITVRVTASAGSSLSNTIKISGLSPDPNPANNSSTVKVKVSK